MIGLFCLRQKTPNIKNHGHSIKNVEKHVKMQGTQTTAETKRNNSTNKTTKQQRKQHETTTQTKQRNNSTTTTAQQDETTAPQTQACGIARARLPKVRKEPNHQGTTAGLIKSKLAPGGGCGGNLGRSRRYPQSTPEPCQPKLR